MCECSKAVEIIENIKANWKGQFDQQAANAQKLSIALEAVEVILAELAKADEPAEEVKEGVPV